MKVFVYFNIRSKLWSVRALEGPQKGRVIAHRETLVLRDCAFKVSEAGRQRVLRERCKNVHAGVVGDWDAEQQTMDYRWRSPVSYNPYKGPGFVWKLTGNPVSRAGRVEFDGRNVFASL